jgi:putative ABC transport system permease protein
MNLTEAVKFSFEALKANRLRTFLTALGLIIGNASVILVVTISLASKDLILDQIRGIGSNLVYASAEVGSQNASQVQGDYIKLADVQALRQELGSRIVAATAVMTMHEDIVVNGKVRQVTVDGVDDCFAQVRHLVLLAGRFFDSSDIALREHVALLSDKLAVRMFGSQEASIGQTIKLSKLQFTVIGTFREKTSTMGIGEISDETILIPISIMRYFVPYERVDPAYIEVRNASDVPNVRQLVNDILERRHRPGAKYEVHDLTAILDTANQIANVLTIVLIIVSAIALVISGIGIMNIMLVTVTERTREIGLRKAVGARRQEILYQFLVEAMVISGVGAIVGILFALSVAIIAGALIPADMNLHIPISVWSILAAFVVSLATGMIFGWLPANRASKLQPTESLRYE